MIGPCYVQFVVEFYFIRSLDVDKFIRKISDPKVEEEFYDWVDYLAVTSLQEKSQLESQSKLAYDYKRSYE